MGNVSALLMTFAVFVTYPYDLFLNTAFLRHTLERKVVGQGHGRHDINRAIIFKQMIKQKINMEKIYGIVTWPFGK